MILLFLSCHGFFAVAFFVEILPISEKIHSFIFLMRDASSYGSFEIMIVYFSKTSVGLY